MVGIIHQYMKGDVTFIETYIRSGTLIDNYNTENSLFKSESAPIASIETFFNLTDGYNQS